jgi:hypothetical protein
VVADQNQQNNSSLNTTAFVATMLPVTATRSASLVLSSKRSLSPLVWQF